MMVRSHHQIQKHTAQHELDKLRTHWKEQFKLQKAIDKTILEKEIQNHYLHQIQSLKNEHQEQLATIASEIAAHKDHLVTADAQKGTRYSHHSNAPTKN